MKSTFFYYTRFGRIAHLMSGQIGPHVTDDFGNSVSVTNAQLRAYIMSADTVA